MRQLLLLAGLAAVVGASAAAAQTAPAERLPRERLDVAAPSSRVSGEPGRMRIERNSCPARPEAGLRRRVVDIAAQEWAFFGFGVVDQMSPPPPRQAGRPRGLPRGFRWLDPAESARVAASIAGYWAVTPQGGWILDNQNQAWNGPDGIASRWRDPWSAAFISWVMCEAGLGDSGRFTRAVAHHVYIDQAIRARGTEADAAYVAYDIGQQAIEPGDLLCSGRRPNYQNLADRERQAGDGARTHCDIVVQPEQGRILAIGGNVRGVVSLKLLPVDGRGLFAHLKLRATSIPTNALDSSPTIAAAGCRPYLQPPVSLAATRVPARQERVSRC